MIEECIQIHTATSNKDREVVVVQSYRNQELILDSIGSRQMAIEIFKASAFAEDEKNIMYLMLPNELQETPPSQIPDSELRNVLGLVQILRGKRTPLQYTRYFVGYNTGLPVIAISIGNQEIILNTAEALNHGHNLMAAAESVVSDKFVFNLLLELKHPNPEKVMEGFKEYRDKFDLNQIFKK